ncbi:MAG TPA: transglycosylase domain-containing protein [Rectinemataceae bacterium]|nr:transglycosylase domain-containing protein [Rectinemataceae bacterium]
MLPFPPSHAQFSRRADRSLGWARLEARQARALVGLLQSGGRAEIGLPAELLPLRTAPRRLGPGRILGMAAALILGLQATYMVATALLIAVYRHVDPPATVLMAYRKWGYGWSLEAPRRLSLHRIPVYVRSMLVSVEDGKFFEHHGLDFEAFRNAREINARFGKPLYGGSTLTMQVARTLFLVPEKSYLRKYLEIVAALELELFLPKDRILELYFDYAEWGKGIFGMEAAARHWYGVGVSGLSRDEAARLIALLSSPIRYRPDNLERNGILRERYAYLQRRYVAMAAPPASDVSLVPAPESPPNPPPPSVEPDAAVADAPADVAAPGAAAQTQGAGAALAPAAPAATPGAPGAVASTPGAPAPKPAAKP